MSRSLHHERRFRTVSAPQRPGLAARGYDGADFFDWSFYSQGTSETGSASADLFAAALEFFGEKELARSAASPWDKGARLAKLVAARGLIEQHGYLRGREELEDAEAMLGVEAGVSTQQLNL